MSVIIVDTTEGEKNYNAHMQFYDQFMKFFLYAFFLFLITVPYKGISTKEVIILLKMALVLGLNKKIRNSGNRRKVYLDEMKIDAVIEKVNGKEETLFKKVFIKYEIYTPESGTKKLSFYNVNFVPFRSKSFYPLPKVGQTIKVYHSKKYPDIYLPSYTDFYKGWPKYG